MPDHFYGHGTANLLIDVFLGTMALITVLLLFRITEVKWLPGMYCFIPVVITFLILPNAFYLATEVRHLFQKDYVADDHQIPAIIGFCLLGLYGLVLTVWSIQIAVTLPFLKGHPYLSIIALCFFSALGTNLGFLDFNSWDAIISPTIIPQGLLDIARSKKYSGLVVIFTIGLSLLSLAIYKVRFWTTYPEG